MESLLDKMPLLFINWEKELHKVHVDVVHPVITEKSNPVHPYDPKVQQLPMFFKFNFYF